MLFAVIGISASNLNSRKLRGTKSIDLVNDELVRAVHHYSAVEHATEPKEFCVIGVSQFVTKEE